MNVSKRAHPDCEPTETLWKGPKHEEGGERPQHSRGSSNVRKTSYDVKGLAFCEERHFHARVFDQRHLLSRNICCGSTLIIRLWTVSSHLVVVSLKHTWEVMDHLSQGDVHTDVDWHKTEHLRGKGLLGRRGLRSVVQLMKNGSVLSRWWVIR